MVDHSAATHPTHKFREVFRAWWRYAASQTKGLLDEIQHVLRPYVCSIEDSEVVFQLQFHALLILVTPDSSEKMNCLSTDAWFPYTVSAPLIGSMDKHSLNSRTLEVQITGHSAEHRSGWGAPISVSTNMIHSTVFRNPVLHMHFYVRFTMRNWCTFTHPHNTSSTQRTRWPSAKQGTCNSAKIPKPPMEAMLS